MARLAMTWINFTQDQLRPGASDNRCEKQLQELVGRRFKSDVEAVFDFPFMT